MAWNMSPQYRPDVLKANLLREKSGQRQSLKLWFLSYFNCLIKPSERMAGTDSCLCVSTSTFARERRMGVAGCLRRLELTKTTVAEPALAVRKSAVFARTTMARSKKKSKIVALIEYLGL